jgi:hypothetical protein
MVGCHHWRTWSRLFLVATGLTVPGCWGSEDDLPREPVAGTVTLDGQPVATGTIRFIPTRPDSSGFAVERGDSINNGKFSISRDVGLVPGTYRVSINSVNTTGERPKADVGPGRVPRAAWELIPFKYNAQSTLSVDVPEGGITDLRFDLRSK